MGAGDIRSLSAGASLFLLPSSRDTGGRAGGTEAYTAWRAVNLQNGMGLSGTPPSHHLGNTGQSAVGRIELRHGGSGATYPQPESLETQRPRCIPGLEPHVVDLGRSGADFELVFPAVKWRGDPAAGSPW